MKTSMRVLVFTGFLFAAACSKDDGPGIQPLELVYEPASFTTSFYQDGSTQEPAINWDGNEGNFTIENQIKGIDIDKSTGQVQWGKLLPLGTHQVEVQAANRFDTVRTVIEVENQFEASLSGGLNNNVDSEVVSNKFIAKIEANGKFSISSALDPDNSIGEGTWEMKKEEVRIVYQAGETKEFRTLQAKITQTKTEAYLSGLWLEGEFPDELPLIFVPSGFFRFDMQ